MPRYACDYHVHDSTIAGKCVNHRQVKWNPAGHRTFGRNCVGNLIWENRARSAYTDVARYFSVHGFQFKKQVSSGELQKAHSTICRDVKHGLVNFHRGPQRGIANKQETRLRPRYLYLSRLAGVGGAGGDDCTEEDATRVRTLLWLHANIHYHGTVAIDYPDVSRIRASAYGASATPLPRPSFLTSHTTVSPRVPNTKTRKPILRQWLMFPRGSPSK